MRKLTFVFVVALIIFTGSGVHAKISDQTWDALQKEYAPAIPHRGLESAYENPDPSKLKNYVVIMQGGIAAEQAHRFITWAEYDYRGVSINVSKGSVSTRTGAPYTYLQPGDVMAIARLDKLLDTVYVGLISPDVYTPANRTMDKHFSRVTTMLEFKLPKGLVKSDDTQAILAAIGEWIKPFNNLTAAQAFSKTVTASQQQTATSE